MGFTSDVGPCPVALTGFSVVISASASFLAFLALNTPDITPTKMINKITITTKTIAFVREITKPSPDALFSSPLSFIGTPSYDISQSFRVGIRVGKLLLGVEGARLSDTCDTNTILFYL